MDAKNRTAEGLKDFLRKNSYLQSTVFAHNPSYIFFRYFQFCNDFQLSQCYADGPVGAQGVPLVSMRSLAIDKKYYSFGMPVWLEASAPGGGNLNRLMIAQDTGSAIHNIFMSLSKQYLILIERLDCLSLKRPDFSRLS
jgi:membrane-bound lytic murein transglycosylase A